MLSIFSSVVRVAKSAVGKWVSRVGASGGGKAYKKTRPGNYYGALVVIVVLGLVATIYSRYEYQNPATAAGSTPPAIGTTWYAALSVDVCGTTLPFLSADTTAKLGFIVLPSNVIRISPVSTADAGNNATLSQFALEYPGLIASSTELAIPTSRGNSNPATTYHNGETCPTHTKYAGKSGQISYAYWTSFGQKTPVITTNPSSIKFAQFLRVTMAFLPANVTPLPPQQTSVNAMVQAAQVTTTTSPVPALSPTTTIPISHAPTTVGPTPATTTTTKTKTKTTVTTAKG